VSARQFKPFDPWSPAVLQSADWSLTQAGSPVGLIEVTDDGTWLEGPGERWSVRVGRGRVGFVIEFAREDAFGPVLTYKPNLRAGGSFDYAGNRYGLAVTPFRGYWTFKGERRVKLARIRYVRARAKGEAGMEVEPFPDAATEPRLLVLLLASCFVLVTQPTSGHEGPQGA
jgi:hypothetical protein